MLLIHVDSLHQATDDLPPGLQIRLLQTIGHFGGKGFQASHHETQLFLHLALRFEVFDLGFQVLQPGAHAGHARCKFLLVDQTLGITLDEPCQPAAHLAYLGFQALGGLGLRLGVQALAVGRRQACGLRQQLADRVPHRRVRRLQAQRLLPTDTRTALPRHVHRACAAVIRSAGSIGTPTIRIAALATDEPALQPVAAAFLRETCAPSVLVQLPLDSLEQGRLDEGRHRHRDPLVFGDRFARVSPTRVGRLATGRTEAWADRRPPGVAKRGFAFVGGVFQHVPDGLVSPVRFARARPDACLMETATHRVDRAAFLADPRKHLLHHPCFVPHDSKTRLSAPFLGGHIPVAVRGMAQDTDMPRLRGVPLAPSAPFQKFGPLVFGNHALHLHQQLLFRGVPQGAIEKDDRHASLRSFLEQHDLIGIMARQAIGTMPVKTIEPARRSDSASALQRWTHE